MSGLTVYRGQPKPIVKAVPRGQCCLSRTAK